MSYADIVEFMFQSGCVMDKCGMKAVSESKSDCFGLIGAYHIWDDRRDRQRQAAHHHPMAWRLGKALDTTPDFWANLQADYDLLTFDPSTLDDIRPLVEA